MAQKTVDYNKAKRDIMIENIEKDIRCVYSLAEKGNIGSARRFITDAKELAEDVKNYPRPIEELNPGRFERFVKRVRYGKNWMDRYVGKNYDAELNLTAGRFKKILQGCSKELDKITRKTDMGKDIVDYSFKAKDFVKAYKS
ncbi:MAG: hypothetical protein JW700_03425 [Candidatus Aenigmarchaeota archaeon]|nr:hypothetical protein [Candidatus Aenigmarchaeota archaeon]